MRIREDLKHLLEGSDLSVRQLSLKSGVRRQSIMKFLAGGNIHIENLEKLIKTLGYRFLMIRNGGSFGPGKRLHFDKAKLKKLCRNNGIKYVMVFGSVLGPDFRKDSDIDLIIKFKRPVTFFELADIENALKKLFKTKHKLDIVTEEGVSPLIWAEIENSREVLYEETA